MNRHIINSVPRFLINVLLLLISGNVLAQKAIVLSKVFQVCAKHQPGLTVDAKQGIDAVEGRVYDGSGAFDFMISTNPNLPAAMNITRGRNGYILPELSSEIKFIAESTGPLGLGSTGRPIGYGTERLYAFNGGTFKTPIGPVQRKIFVQLWSDEHYRNVVLLQTVGDSLYRCQ